MTTLTREQVAPVFRLPDCSLHPGTPAVVDGRTVSGQWGFLCPRCFAALGVGLGTGNGQVLIPQEPPHHMGDMTAPCHSCGATWSNADKGGHMEHTKACLYNLAITAFPELY